MSRLADETWSGPFTRRALAGVPALAAAAAMCLAAGAPAAQAPTTSTSTSTYGAPPSAAGGPAATGTRAPAPPGTSTAKPQLPTELWREFPLEPHATSSRPGRAGPAPTSAHRPVASPEASTTTLWGIPKMAVYAVVLGCALLLALLTVAATLGRLRRLPGHRHGDVAVAGVGLLAASPDTRPRGDERHGATRRRPPSGGGGAGGPDRGSAVADELLERQPEIREAAERIAEMKRAAADEAEHMLRSAEAESQELHRRAAVEAERAGQMLVDAEQSAEQMLKSVQAESLERRRQAAADAERAGQLLAEAEQSAERVLARVKAHTQALRESAQEEATRRLVEEANAPRVRVRRFDLAAVFAVIGREVIVFLRTWRSMTFAAIVEPTIFLLAFGLGIGALIKSVQGRDYIQFVGTGVVATTVVFSSAFPSMFQTFVKSRFQKLYDSILSTPVDVPELVTAEMLWTATRTGIYALAPVAVAVGFGLRPHWGVALVPLIAFITAFGFAGFGIAIAARAKAITSFNYIISGLLTPLLLVAGAYFPVDQLPEWAKAANNANPLYHCVELVRDAVFGIDLQAGAVHLGALLAFAAITWWLAVRRLRPMLID
ncbi:MAG: lipooligosaccharide transport system permease protein [bacterium]|jgi:lipooligosaccharide transport system permease protein